MSKVKYKKILKQVIPGKIRKKIKSATKKQPRLTVIVPVYNVEDHIDKCLYTIVSQTYKNLDIIIIDDGSTDNSFDIADSYRKKDSRIRLHRKENNGLGAARNTGIELARGEYITFADSDDTIPINSYSKMMKTLLNTGSDFIVGKIQRIDGGKKWVPEWAESVHSVDRNAVTLSECPEIIYDVFATNKVYKTCFFNEYVKSYPENISYEDQLPSVKSYVNASRFDISSSITYNWHVRDDGTSISQQKGSIKDVSDRMSVMLDVLKYVKSEVNDKSIINKYYEKLLGLDLRLYYMQIPRVDNKYWKVLRGGVMELYDNVTEDIFQHLEINDRCYLNSIINDSTEDVSKISVYIDGYGRSYPVRAKSNSLVAQPVYNTMLKNPASDSILTLNNLTKYTSRIYEINISDEAENLLSLTGASFINDISVDKYKSFNITAVSLETVETVEADSIEGNVDTSRFEYFNNRYIDYSKSGFKAKFNLDKLLHGRFVFRVDIGTEYGFFSFYLNKIFKNSQASYGRTLSHDNKICLEHKAEDITGFNTSAIVFKNILDDTARVIPGFHAKQKSKSYIEVDSYDIKNGYIDVMGEYKITEEFSEPAICLVTTTGLHEIDSDVKSSGGRFNSKIELIDNATKLPLRSGKFTLVLKYKDIDNKIKTVRSFVSESLNSILPVNEYYKLYNLRITRTPRAASFHVNLSPPMHKTEMGKYNQTRLENEYNKLVDKGEVVKNSYFCESYNGSNIDDSPLTISYEIKRTHPDANIYWSIEDRSIAAPEGMTGIVMYTKEWYEKLATSQVLINNNNFPVVFRKSKNQKYIQTWHGTPLKRIGNDVPNANLSLKYRDLMVKESESWDVLLAQNEYSRKMLPKAFGYKGKVIDQGYPRNDDLLGDNTDRIKKLREYYSIPKDNKIILYAPTWRDTKKDSNGRYKLQSYLDVNIMKDKLPDYTVLMRGHPNTRKSNTKYNNVIDVSNYPHINDLYLSSDILITDYSSVMFDFAVTRKPILFLAPDIEEYSSSIRGFYFDLKEKAPGPIVDDTNEIVDSVEQINLIRDRYSDKYKLFVDEFCSNDDGLAAKRVVESILK